MKGRSIGADHFYGLAVLLWVTGGVQCLLYFMDAYDPDQNLLRSLDLIVLTLDPAGDQVRALLAEMTLVKLVLVSIDHGIDLLAALLVHILGFLSFFAGRSVDPKAGLGANRKAAISAF